MTVEITAELMGAVCAILKIRSQNTNTYLVISGDFNRRDVAYAIGDCPDMCYSNIAHTE